MLVLELAHVVYIIIDDDIEVLGAFVTGDLIFGERL